MSKEKNAITTKSRNILRIPKTPYVYSLTDPTTGEVFYIGKGNNNRLYAHEKEARRGISGAKCDRIRTILGMGRSVQYSILGEYNTDKEAYSAEKCFIASHDGLTNIMSGGGGERVSSQDKAKTMLGRMKTYDDWISDMSDSTRKLVINVFGSTKQRYEYMVYNLSSIMNMRGEIP